MEQIHPRLLPSIDSVSNFYELNIRTYVKSSGKPGVYFLSIEAYFTTLIISIVLGITLYFFGRNSKKNINFIEQLILIILVYIIIGLLISIPFYLSNFQVTFISAFFEAISGLTGTGFSIFKNIIFMTSPCIFTI